MYVTQERRIGINSEQKSATAMMRHHSVETSDTKYNDQSPQEIMLPALEVMNSMLKDVLK